MGKRICSIDGCNAPARGLGYCSKHYARFKRTGTTDRKGTVAERFWECVDKSGDCWLWTAALKGDGYGSLLHNGSIKTAHRVAYELTHGPIPDGLDLDHMCHNKRCVRPEHLRPVTHGQNMQNRKGANRNSKSGIRGVSWISAARRWKVDVGFQKNHYHGGYFTNIEDAERAAHELRDKLFTHHVPTTLGLTEQRET